LVDEEYKNEQHRILASDIEEYLEPIYQSEASFIICILGQSYPTRIWTTFEAKHFGKRIELGEVLPIVVDDTQIDVFSSLTKIGYIHFDSKGDVDKQVQDIVTMFKNKLHEVK